MKANSLLNKDIVINFDFINTWERDYISARIANRILQSDKNIQERKGYTINLDIVNIRNNLHYVIKNIVIDNSGLWSGCLYIDIDDTCEYPIMKFVLAITNDKNKLNNNYTNFPIFTYQNRGCIFTLNN